MTIQEMNRQIIAYAVERLRTIVGNGECWTLAHDAIESAGGQTPQGRGNQLYRWGTPVRERRLQPGNIIQFENYEFQIVRGNTTRTEVRGNPRHTAIVESVRTDGAINVLECNVMRSRMVRRSTVYLRDGTYQGDQVTVISGEFAFYQVRQRH